MNKKLIALLLVIALATTSVFAVGIGIQLGGLAGLQGRFAAALTVKPSDNVPWVFAVDFAISPNWINIGLAADWWAMNPEIKGLWHWFWGFGLGMYADLIGNVGAGFGLGPRFLIGMNWRFTSWFELYTHIAWQPMLGFGAVYNGFINYNNNFYFSLVNFPINVGIRFWF